MKTSPKKRAYMRAYYKANRACILEKCHKWREANRDLDRKRARAWALRNPERYKARQAAYREQHRDEHREYCQRYYAMNHERLVKYSREKRRAVRQYIWDYLAEHPCVDCGETDPIVLEFDHVRGEKKFAIAFANRRPFDEVLAEIEKCDVRCGNCHRKRTFWQRNYGSMLNEKQLATLSRPGSA